jgi:multiple sugar transport system ATP-binding protein
VVNDLPPKDRDIAMVFQNYALYPHMSVFDNMAFGLKLRRVPAKELRRRVDEAAEILGLGGLLTRKPRELSGGQRQRVALGRAIVRSPQAFLMDEPLSNLDAKLRAQMRTEIARLHHRIQSTFVFVTHDQTEAMTMGDRIAILNGGRLQQVGSPGTVYEQPANKFVASFIGSPAMNFFEGARVERRDGVYVHLDEGGVLRMPESLATRADGYIGKTVTLGIRPEHLQPQRFTENAGNDGQTMSLKVDIVEQLGNEQLVYGALGGKQVVARTSAHPIIRPGDQVPMRFEMERAHLFDAYDERALTSAPWEE